MVEQMTEWLKLSLFWLYYFMNYLIPLCVIVASYGLILYKLHTASQQRYQRRQQFLGPNGLWCPSLWRQCQEMSVASPVSTWATVECALPTTARLHVNTNASECYMLSSATLGMQRMLQASVVSCAGATSNLAQQKSHHKGPDDVGVEGSNLALPRSSLYRRAKVRSIQMSFLVCGAFLTCWTPYYIAYLVSTQSSTENVNSTQPDIKIHVMTMFGQLSTIFNALIYGTSQWYTRYKMFKETRKRRVMRTRRPPQPPLMEVAMANGASGGVLNGPKALPHHHFLVQDNLNNNILTINAPQPNSQNNTKSSSQKLWNKKLSNSSNSQKKSEVRL